MNGGSIYAKCWKRSGLLLLSNLWMTKSPPQFSSSTTFSVESIFLITFMKKLAVFFFLWEIIHEDTSCWRISSQKEIFFSQRKKNILSIDLQNQQRIIQEKNNIFWKSFCYSGVQITKFLKGFLNKQQIVANNKKRIWWMRKKEKKN